MVVVCDDENRENEGDLTLAAQFATPEAINFMATEGRGLICLALTAERCDELGPRPDGGQERVAPSRPPSRSRSRPARASPPGSPPHDRAHTIQVAIDPRRSPTDLVQPGHVFPLKAKDGGVLERAGQTEAAVDLARLAGLIPAGVICEIMNEDGTMARVPDLVPYCERHGLEDDHGRRPDRLPAADREARRAGRGDASCRPRSASSPRSATARWSTTSTTSRWSRATSAAQDDVLVRVHSECLTGDVFHSLRCDCGEQLEAALAMIEREGAGVLLYLSQEGRGIGLLNKLRAYRLQEEGLDTVDANLKLGLPADLRDYGIGAQILVDLGLTSIRILTNNPKKIHGLEGYGLSVADQVPIQAVPNPHNEDYLRTKRESLGHTLHHQGLPLDEELIHDEHAARPSASARRERGRPGSRGC